LSKTQPRDLYVPLPGLGDFVATLAELFRTLYRAAHDHQARSSPPAETDGQIGDILVVDDGATPKIYGKTAAGWKSATLS
jgi:hypothetical protein